MTASSQSLEIEGSHDSVIGSLTAESRERRHMELGLLHYYTTEVSQSLPGTFLPAVKKVWSVDVPKMALKYNPLLNAILAISILQMSATGNNELSWVISDLPTQRARYLEATLQEHRRAISSIDQSTADPASFTSILLSFDAFASMRERQLIPYEPPTQWLQLCKGVRNVFRTTMEMVRKDPTSSINVAVEMSAPLVDPSAIFCEANRSRFPRLLQPQIAELEADADNEAYMNTICYVGAAMRALESGEHIGMLARRLMMFPILMPTRFTELLGQRRARALVILAHFFGVASHCKDSWLVGDTPEREIRAIATYLGPEWQYVMEWPLETIEKI